MKPVISLRTSSILFSLFLFWMIPSCLSGQPSRDYTDIDRRATKAPKRVTKDLEKLTKYLCKQTSDDYDKVRAICMWISAHIEYDRRSLTDKNYFYNFNSAEVLSKRKAVCSGFSRLLSDMCTLAGIESQVISGYSKQTLTSNKDRNRPDHAWNTVLIDDTWYLIDVTWAQGLSTIDNHNDDYFLSSPQYFIKTHLPSIEMWQLLDCPISIEQYEMNQFEVYNHLDSLTPCYNYTDTIKQFFSLTPADQRLYRDRRIYSFNPTVENGETFGHALVDYAGNIVDEIELLRQEGKNDNIVANYQEVATLLTEAYAITEFYPWQLELYGSSLINLALGLYQTTPVDTPERKSSILSHLDRAAEIIADSDNVFLEHIKTQALNHKKEIETALKKTSE